MGRGRKEGQALPVGDLADRALRLTKEQVAERELNAAIRLFCAADDPVAVHVLTMAASDILTPIGRKKGLEVSDVTVEIVIKDEYVAAYKELLREPYTFMKHGAKDGDATLETFVPEVNEFMLLKTVGDFGIVFGRYSLEMLLFLAWIRGKHPDVINAGPFADQLDEVRSYITAVGGQSELSTIAQALTQERAGRSA